MVIESLPTEQQIRRKGSFLGYSLGIGENYAETFKFEQKNYVLLDEVDKNGRVVYNVSRYYGKISELYRCFNEIDGFPN